MSRVIPLTRGLKTIVDDEDYEMLSAFSWSAYRYMAGQVYAVRSVTIDGLQKKVGMHRVLLLPAPDQLVDHVNGDTLDNRRSNIRLCSRYENRLNSKVDRRSETGVKGVTRRSRNGKFRAHIGANGKRIWLGSFDSIEEAMDARNTAAMELHGEFARLSSLPSRACEVM